MSYFKETIIQENGEIIEVDNRVFSSVVEVQIIGIKTSTAEEILNRYPEYKQRNASLGVLPINEANEIKDRIDEIRNYSNSLEQQILAITWDGTEQNRASACDAVQNIQWNYIPNPNLPKRYTAYQFLQRFTAQERASFRAAAINDPNVADFQQLASAAQEILTNDPTTLAGMNYLVSVGLLTQQRMNEILS